MKSSPHPPQLEKANASSEDPLYQKKKKKKIQNGLKSEQAAPKWFHPTPARMDITPPTWTSCCPWLVPSAAASHGQGKMPLTPVPPSVK